jgi:hypothetical protein
MMLILVFILVVLGLDLLAFGITRFYERSYESGSLLLFLAMYFFNFWLGWRIAVRITAPRASRGA